MPREARLRAERAAGICIRHGEARSVRRDVQRPDARAVRLVEARTRNDCGCRLFPESLLLLLGRARCRGPTAVRGPRIGRADGDELSRRAAYATPAIDARFRRETHGRAVAGRGG